MGLVGKGSSIVRFSLPEKIVRKGAFSCRAVWFSTETLDRRHGVRRSPNKGTRPKTYRGGTPLYMSFIDLTKKYDSVSPTLQ